MSMNPQNMLQILGALNNFRSTHPKFAGFIAMMLRTGVPEGTVIEVTVTKPGEEGVTTNMKVTESDIRLFEALKEMV